MDGQRCGHPLEGLTFSAAVEGRASVRRFLPDPVPRDDVRAMVACATRAANAGNAQCWRFVAVDDGPTRGAMAAAVDAALDEMAAWPECADRGADIKAVRAYATFFADAPVVVAVFVLPYESRGDELLQLHGASREEHDRRRQRPTCRASAPPCSCSARRRTPWATGAAG